MIKTLILSNGSSIDFVVSDDYDYLKRNSDEYETEVIIRTSNKKILICKDYLNYIVKELLQKLNAIADLELLDVFYRYQIGKAYNEYLYCIDNEKELDRDCLQEKNDNWIGDKFLLFELPRKRITWLYNKNGKHTLEITPLYEKHFEESDESCYREFISKFETVEKIDLSKEDIVGLIELLNYFS